APSRHGPVAQPDGAAQGLATAQGGCAAETDPTATAEPPKPNEGDGRSEGDRAGQLLRGTRSYSSPSCPIPPPASGLFARFETVCAHWAPEGGRRVTGATRPAATMPPKWAPGPPSRRGRRRRPCTRGRPRGRHRGRGRRRRP